MKKSIAIFTLLVLTSITTSHASNEAYVKAMQKEIQSLFEAGSLEDLQKSTNTFVRIGEMNPDEWLPPYYASLALTHMGFRADGDTSEKDKYFAQAKKHLEKAIKLSPNNSEITALEGFITLGELSADPGSRGQHLSGVVMQTLGKAIEQNRTNPRAVILMAQMELGMAQFFGQGTEKACGLVKSSLVLFEKEATFPDDTLEPRWGKEMAQQMKATCD